AWELGDISLLLEVQCHFENVTQTQRAEGELMALKQRPHQSSAGLPANYNIGQNSFWFINSKQGLIKACGRPMHSVACPLG
ncbi:hypothetical protein E2320_020161, partial [Naja naja]